MQGESHGLLLNECPDDVPADMEFSCTVILLAEFSDDPTVSVSFPSEAASTYDIAGE